MKPTSTRAERKGMILLLVMAMMAIFAMLVIAFMVVSQHASKSAGYAAKAGETRELDSLRTAEEDTYRAFLDVMVGSKNPNSVLYHHGIMPNLYGNPRIRYDANDNYKQVNWDYLSGWVLNSKWVIPGGADDPIGTTGNSLGTNGLIRIEFQLDSDFIEDQFPTSATDYQEKRYREFVRALDMMGNVITFTDTDDKDLKNKSLRIIDWNISGKWDNYALILILYSENAVPLPQIDDLCFINSAPFSGRGVGYGELDSSGDHIPPKSRNQPQLLLADEDGTYFALYPNPTAPSHMNGYSELRNYLDSNLVMVNPDHTAANTQSMFLSWFHKVNDGTENYVQTSLPSFHRPDIFDEDMYVFKTFADMQNSYPGITVAEFDEFVAKKRKLSMRPLSEDHVNFDGSNPAYHVLYGPFDVDNDRDGTPDSVWVFPGAPIYTDKYGKTYTKCIAVLAKDLDSRINANLHGNVAHLDTDYHSDLYYENNFPVIDTIGNLDLVFPVIGNDMTKHYQSGGTPPRLTVRGQGYGPAAVRLDYGLFNALLKYDNSNKAQAILKSRRFMENLFFGPMRTFSTIPSANPAPAVSFVVPGRFGLDGDGYTAVYNDRLARRPGDLSATGASTPLEWAKYYALDASDVPIVSPLDGKSVEFSPYGGRSPDYREMAPQMYDILGHTANAPYGWDPTSRLWLNGVHLNNPYLQEPYQLTNLDEPFTLAEFEALLRPNDGDSASLPQRLRNMFMGDIPTDKAFDANITDNTWNDIRMRSEREEDARAAGENLTVISSDIPSPNRMIRGYPGIYSLIVHCLREENPSEDIDDIAEAAQELFGRLPIEVRQGRRIDLNRLAKSPLWLNVTGNAAKHEANHKKGLTMRAEYAQGIYIMLMAMCYEQIKYYDYGSIFETITTNSKKEDLIKTRLAQWSVNLVDFADRDAVMTPMLFDINPFKFKQPGVGGWDPDADMSTFDNAVNVKNALTASGSNVRLIFGMERPDLVLTETMATHQRNVADTGNDLTHNKYIYNTNDPRDPDYDQVRIPEASAWFELYCTANPNQPYQPEELFTLSNGGWYLDLDRTTPDGYSVHRIAISEGTNAMYTNEEQSDGTFIQKYKSLNQKANVKNSIVARISDPAFSFQPKQHRENGSGGDLVDDYNRSSVLGHEAVTNPDDEIELDRIVWLSSTAPTDSNYDFERMFWNRSGATTLEPNGYLVIAPRITTHLGSKKISTVAVPPVTQYGDPSGLGIDFSTSMLDNAAGSGTMYDDIKKPKVMVCAANLPVGNGWVGNETEEHAYLGTGTAGIGINISAPIPTKQYYEKPIVANANNKTSGGTNIVDTYTLPIGTPIEEANPTISTHYPLSDDFLVGEGTVPYYKSAFLQRVADPLRDYDPITNPYITVDWNMMDLTVFIGENSGPDTTPEHTLTGIYEPPLKNSGANELRLSSRQWGRTAMPSGVASDYPNPWMRLFDPAKGMDPSVTADPTNTVQAAALTSAAFPHLANHTLGRYNSDLEVGATPLVWRKTDTDAAGYNEVYIGSPQAPFIHLPWNDAPYVTPYDIMQVPASAPGRFGIEFIQRKETVVPEEAGSLGTGGRYGFDGEEKNRIGHQLNFFNSDPGPSTVSSTNPYKSLNLAEFLEFVHVPSPYVGTERLLNYDTVSGNFNGDEPYTVSTFREPGKINLNTMNASAYCALRGDRFGPEYSEIYNEMEFDDMIPFELPFRSAAAANHTSQYYRNPADATLLRKKIALNTPTNIDTPNGTKMRPLLAPNDMPDALANTYNDVESIQRLSNLSTTRSNVFAVWITVGYFEVEKVHFADPSVDPSDNKNVNIARAAIGLPPITDSDEFYAIYPDGYRFGKELGYHTGETVRHRAFYMIDRSIPVGVRQGELNNVEDTILIKRVLE